MMLLLIRVVVVVVVVSSSSSSSSSSSNIHKITLHRNSESDNWGINTDYKNNNIYVTEVPNNSGLQVKDIILSINNINFANLTKEEFNNARKQIRNVKGLELNLVVERN